MQIHSKGYIIRSQNNDIIFSEEKIDKELLLEINKDINSNYEIYTNDCELDENRNIQTNNNCWFLFRKAIQGNNFKYKVKQGDILRFGRISTRIKEIVINKRATINDINNNIIKVTNNNINNETNNINNNNYINNINFEPVNKSGEITSRKEGGVVTKINTLRISSDTKTINKLKLNTLKKSPEDDYNKIKIAQTIPVNFMQLQISNKKRKFPKLCKVCYGEEENEENPLVQPCKCSGSLKYIHLNCLKHWLNTKSCIKIEGNERFSIFLVKQIECEICKEKFPDFVKHKDKLYEILEPDIEYESYCYFEILTLDKDGRRNIYIINLEKNMTLKMGRGHESHLNLNDISVSRVHGLLTIENKKIYLIDNNSKFGSLILVQNPILKLIEDLPLHIQIGRTYLECKIKRNFSFFLCCGISEKPDLNYYFQQNEEKKQPNLLNMFTVKSEIDFSEEYEINEKDKIPVYEEEKNNDNKIKINEVNTFYENDYYGNVKDNDRIKFSKEETFVENRKSLNNEEEKNIENKDNKDNNIEQKGLQERINEVESIVLESESENHSS